MVRFFKTYALFISMMVGILFHSVFVDVSFLTRYFMDDPLTDITFITKYMLFFMLLIVYCKVSVRQLHLKKWHLYLGCFQFTACMLVYLIVSRINETLADGSMICFLMPTATSAPVITGILGGSVAGLITYSVTSNFMIAIMAPLFFSLIGAHGSSLEDPTFIQSFFIICEKVFPLIFGPFALSLILKRYFPKIHDFLKIKQGISFWLWVVALILLMSRTTTDLLNMDASDYKYAFLLALASLLVCLIQFFVGRRLGDTYHNKVASGQALGQKNTILAIWMAQTFFSPLVAVAPATYVLWQNLVNSYQIWKHQRKNLPSSKI